LQWQRWRARALAPAGQLEGLVNQERVTDNRDPRQVERELRAKVEAALAELRRTVERFEQLAIRLELESRGELR